MKFSLAALFIGFIFVIPVSNAIPDENPENSEGSTFTEKQEPTVRTGRFFKLKQSFSKGKQTSVTQDQQPPSDKPSVTQKRNTDTEVPNNAATAKHQETTQQPPGDKPSVTQKRNTDTEVPNNAATVKHQETPQQPHAYKPSVTQKRNTDTEVPNNATAAKHQETPHAGKTPAGKPSAYKSSVTQKRNADTEVPNNATTVKHQETPHADTKQEFTVTKVTVTKENTVSLLEKTQLVRAVIEGDIEKYRASIAEFKALIDDPQEFNTILTNIFKKEIVDGKKLPVLMVETKTNREFFANEVFDLFTIGILADIPDLEQTDQLLEAAKQANNEKAQNRLEVLQNILKQHQQTLAAKENQHQAEQERREEKHQIREIALQKDLIQEVESKYSRNLTLSVGGIAVGGILSVWAYNLKKYSQPDDKLLSPPIIDFLSKLTENDVSLGVLVAGVPTITAGIIGCYQAVKKRKKQKQQIINGHSHIFTGKDL